LAQQIRRASVSAGANRQRSATLSIQELALLEARDSRGSRSRAWAAPIHRLAFHPEIP
jgi:hypothetical protein